MASRSKDSSQELRAQAAPYEKVTSSDALTPLVTQHPDAVAYLKKQAAYHLSSAQLHEVGRTNPKAARSAALKKLKQHNQMLKKQHKALMGIRGLLKRQPKGQKQVTVNTLVGGVQSTRVVTKAELKQEEAAFSAALDATVALLKDTLSIRKRGAGRAGFNTTPVRIPQQLRSFFQANKDLFGTVMYSRRTSAPKFTKKGEKSKKELEEEKNDFNDQQGRSLVAGASWSGTGVAGVEASNANLLDQLPLLNQGISSANLVGQLIRIYADKKLTREVNNADGSISLVYDYTLDAGEPNANPLSRYFPEEAVRSAYLNDLSASVRAGKISQDKANKRAAAFNLHAIIPRTFTSLQYIWAGAKDAANKIPKNLAGSKTPNPEFQQYIGSLERESKIVNMTHRALKRFYEGSPNTAWSRKAAAQKLVRRRPKAKTA